MKKFFINNLLLLVLLSAAQSFAAGEKEIITTRLAMAHYSAPLTTEQRDVYSKQLEEYGFQLGMQSYIDARIARELQENLLQQAPKKKSDSKALKYLFEYKGVPAAVDAEHMGSFLPEGYVVPLDWNVKFEKGETVKNFVELDIEEPAKTSPLTASPDGRYVALGCYGMRDKEGGILVWDMQKGSGEPQKILIERNNYAVAIIEFDSRGRLAYVAYNFSDRTQIVVGMVDLPSLAQNERQLRGVERWKGTIATKGAKLCLSDDSNYLKIITSEGALIIDFATGTPLLEDQSPQDTAFPPGCELRYELAAYSLNRNEVALKNYFKTDIFFEKKDDSGQWNRYGTMINISQNRPENDGIEAIGLSPKGLRLCVVQSKPSSYELLIYDMKDRSTVRIDEIVRSRGVLSTEILGVSFSPGGHQLLLGIHDIRQKKIIIKIYDLEELVDYADMPPLEDAPDDAPDDAPAGE